MNKAEKYLKKMRVNPTNWRIEHLETVADRYGINVRKSGGSHVIFDLQFSAYQLYVPARRPIKSAYVKRFITLIDQVGQEQLS